MNLTNPGPPVLTELKGGARLPDRTILPFVNQMAMLPTGPSILPLVPTQALPSGLPTIDVVIEGAILDPVLGVTLSRHNVTLHPAAMKRALAILALLLAGCATVNVTPPQPGHQIADQARDICLD